MRCTTKRGLTSLLMMAVAFASVQARDIVLVKKGKALATIYHPLEAEAPAGETRSDPG